MGDEHRAARGLAPGTAVNVITWRGLRIAVTVCLDVELTALWARPATLDLDLVLVPARTDLHRRRGRARTARGERRTQPRALRLPAPGRPVRRLRHGDAEAEVWPGAWAADGVTIVDPDQQV